jgi:hypothetical protein
MILDFIIEQFCNFTGAVLSVLPDVPPTPQAVIDGGQWVISTIGGVIGILNMIYTPAIMTAVVVIAVGIFNFEWLYHSVMWVLKKIPMINIK